MLSGFGNIIKLSQNDGRKTESKKLLKKLEKKLLTKSLRFGNMNKLSQDGRTLKTS